MKKILKITGLALIAIIVAAGLYVAANWTTIKNFLPMASGAYAKFMCSSMFVEGKDEEAARNWSRLSLPIQECVIDRGKKTVTVRALGKTSTARYINERFGCTLD